MGQRRRERRESELCGRWEYRFQQSPELTFIGLLLFVGEFLFNLHKGSLKVDTIVIPISSKQKLETETQIRELPEVKTSI